VADNKCLSIVVPVFNVEKYLGRCIDSLLKTKGIENTEIIIVDDGSTDDSGRIADCYSLKYDYINCFHKSNGGLSDARNYGLLHASARYVFFCDSDDLVFPEAFSKIIDCTSEEDVDVLLWDGVPIDEDDNKADLKRSYRIVHDGLTDLAGPASGLDVMVNQIKTHGECPMTVWLMACKRDFLLENSLSFAEELLHEDELWSAQVYVKSSKVLYIPECVYGYRIRKTSIMGSQNEHPEPHIRSFDYIMNYLYDWYHSNVTDQYELKVILSNWAHKYLWIIDYYRYDETSVPVKVRRSHIWGSCRGIKDRIKGCILILGIRPYCKLMRTIRILKRRDKQIDD